jgi:hypothetical protein
MKSVNLVPYCPLPTNHGGKVEMLKHLDILATLGECTIASAATRPVGMGWSNAVRSELEKRGFRVKLREDTHPSKTWRQWLGIAYASLCKGLGLARAFGHANPYHRYAFHARWWMDLSRETDLAIINYSYWAWLPTLCPKIIILHDLLSNTMWGGRHREIEDLRKADLVVVISKDEEEQLRQLGISNIIWSPPLVKPAFFEMKQSVGIIGSANPFNREGMRWLASVSPPSSLSINVYGALSQYVSLPNVNKIASYVDPHKPYQDCGIILLPTALGMGVQIKVVEALACGRAIVARHGAMRGIPEGQGAWIEVDSPGEMWAQAERLQSDRQKCCDQGVKARSYYQTYLDHKKIFADLQSAYKNLANATKKKFCDENLFK